MTEAVLLLSGGLDSAANLAFGIGAGYRVHALFVDYGQVATKRERTAAKKLAHTYGATFRELQVPLQFLKSGLFREQSFAFLNSEELDDPRRTQESAKKVWVPNRNGVLVHLAAAYAESLKCSKVLVGFNAEEARSFPDNSLEFIEAVNRSLVYSTANRVQVESFTVGMDKVEMVRALRDKYPDFPFEDVWSCYQGNAVPCLECESCLRHQRAVGKVSYESRDTSRSTGSELHGH